MSGPAGLNGRSAMEEGATTRCTRVGTNNTKSEADWITARHARGDDGRLDPLAEDVQTAEGDSLPGCPLPSSFLVNSLLRCLVQSEGGTGRVDRPTDAADVRHVDDLAGRL